MARLWDDLTKWLEEASKVIGKEAGDLTLKGQLKIQIYELKRTLRENFITLGAIVFEEVFEKKKPDWEKHKIVITTVKKIKSLKTKLKKRQKEYNKIGVKKK